MASTPPHAVRLQIGTVRTLQRDGSHDDRHSLPCPLRGCSTRLEACEGCPRHQRTHLSLWEEERHLECALDGAVAPVAAVAGLTPQVLPGLAAADDAPVSAFMRRNVECVAPDTTLDQVLDVLLDGEGGGVPVVDPEGRPLGMVSGADLLEVRAEEPPRDRSRPTGPRWWSRPLLREDPRATAGDVMARPALTVREDVPMMDAAALMAAHRVHRVPVVGRDGAVVGVLSALEVLRWETCCAPRH